ncbi:hypothetical protein A3A14_01285 [Candidatus Daviesbacteria bacterium RIFCSPLOWO2_01_FULL_43_38]|uniref:methionine--tRNA ligase n=2 Tax=Candidatus Daviesiibacteriota TaxID=1752718 RepID=A0A1F5K7Q1_9BACT|nr:MAG: Methionyl-tRNA synthetase [Candidatus Daviesbacteria bacterium GW2011_GWA2_42_7]OGE20124.1 MAG: hypothetical protein A2874_02970 [Candidatus Daviesbacteria bacterium RIFCSPHIGHO2_01_FULL_43_17]OGE36864.1 MAG: hypothetical protein A3E45_03410 [Candidatus Daviesbacteria bacterium RIFCSPHIGHO2_12_FULL_43_11]OGE63290.1 MAG: hypothetical protein A3A14_01285 [Candidatus Daviesbacteria bacterium RIFCSPLOWO2_01_FULL_43_38]
MKKFYITTAIDYVNDTIHLGHIFQKVVADVLARYRRIRLGDTNVFFLTGTDEYGQRVEKAAKEAGIPTKEFARKIAASDKVQQDSLNISYDKFIETTDDDHTKVAQEIWKRVEAGGDIYLGKYEGLYCEGCEAFYTEKDLTFGKCPFHPTLEVKRVTEENYFFKWSKYKDFLTDYLQKNPDFVVPEARRKEMLAFAKDIKDIPVSRTNFSWGIPVTEHPGHVMYVWFDALTNYLTGVGFLENPKLFEKFWPADAHILGKDNARWHVLLWPAILKSAGIELPKTILVNGFLSLNGQKMSKSIGNVIRPTEWVEKYGADAVRYYLLRYTTLTEDSDISEEKLIQAYNSDLANGLGNLVARVAKLCETNNVSEASNNFTISEEVASLISSYKLNEALGYIWCEISDTDKLINLQKPWTLEGEELQKTLKELILHIRQIAHDLQPFLPETSEKILQQFSGEIKSAPPLFPRI